MMCAMQLKMKEAKNIRRLGQEVLLQRSDVETFFVSSLKYIREQIAQESLSEEPQMPMRSSPAGRGRDISELSWPDREQVLRLAFAKINSQARSTSRACQSIHLLSCKLPGSVPPTNLFPRTH
jgi:hypothetical protein